MSSVASQPRHAVFLYCIGAVSSHRPINSVITDLVYLDTSMYIRDTILWLVSEYTIQAFWFYCWCGISVSLKKKIVIEKLVSLVAYSFSS